MAVKKFLIYISIYLQVKKLERWLYNMKKVQRYFLDFDFLKYEKTLKFKNENSFKIIKNRKKL